MRCLLVHLAHARLILISSCRCISGSFLPREALNLSFDCIHIEVMLVASSDRISSIRHLKSPLIIFEHEVVSVGHSQLLNLPWNTHYSAIVSCTIYRLGAFCYHTCCLKMIFRLVTLT